MEDLKKETPTDKKLEVKKEEVKKSEVSSKKVEDTPEATPKAEAKRKRKGNDAEYDYANRPKVKAPAVRTPEAN